MRYLFLKISSAIITFLVVALCFTRVSAKELNYLCFMQTSSGKTIDLSNTLCQSKKRKVKGSVNAESDTKQQTLMEVYKRKGRRRY
jgi:hypothetical protein